MNTLIHVHIQKLKLKLFTFLLSVFAVICDHISAQIRPSEGGCDYSWSFSSPCVMT